MALPLCGPRARSKPPRRRFRASVLTPIILVIHSANRRESAWCESESMTAFVRGRDDLPATGDSLPSHSQGVAGYRSSDRQGRRSGGRAADEAAARRKLRACPLADAKAACFVKRPLGYPSGLRMRGAAKRTRHRAFGSRTCPAASGAFGPARCTPAGPRASAHGLSGGTEASAEDPARSGMSASAGMPNGLERERKFPIRRAANRQGFGPDGEPAGKPDSGFGRSRTPEKAAIVNPRFRRRRLETAQRGTPRLPGKDPAPGQWGPAGMSAPITVSGGVALRGAPGWRRKRFSGMS